MSVQSWDQDGVKEESREGFLEEVMKVLANTGSADPVLKETEPVSS